MKKFYFFRNPRKFADIKPDPMKKLTLFSAILSIAMVATFLSCSKQTTVEPCDGKGTLNVENKLDSAISVTIVQTRLNKSVSKDYTYPFTLAGNQPYTLNIDGPQYHRDTTIMLLSCDNKLLLVIK